jgi:hypothetical protein
MFEEEQRVWLGLGVTPASMTRFDFKRLTISTT